jgi:hypothetical protein
MKMRGLPNLWGVGIVLGVAALASAGPATRPVDRSTPIAALITYTDARQHDDADAIEQCFQATGEREQLMLHALADLTASNAAMGKAAISRFGAEAVQKYHLTANISMILPPVAFPDLPKAHVDLNGDKAVVSEGDWRPVNLVRSGDQWRIDFSHIVSEINADLPTVRQNMPALLGFAKIMRETAADITAGHFRTAEEAAVILKLRLTRSHERSGATDAPATRP